MTFQTWSFPAAGLVALTSLLLILVRDWRISLGSLAIQYAGLFILVAMEWSLTLAITQLIAGWIAGAILGMAVLSVPETAITRSSLLETQQTPRGLFYLLAAIFTGLVVTSATPQLAQWIPGMETRQCWGGLIMIGLGLLRLSFASSPISTTCGLLTLVCGIETLYAPMDGSPFTAGLFAAATLGVALVGAYLVVAPSSDDL